jgi:hypothetical protein
MEEETPMSEQPDEVMVARMLRVAADAEARRGAMAMAALQFEIAAALRSLDELQSLFGMATA